MRIATEEQYDEIVKIFNQNKDIFPHIRTDYIKRMITSHKCIYTDGIVIMYNRYKRTNKIGNIVAEKYSYTIKQIVNANKGNGNAAKIIQEFLQSVSDPVYLSVRADNERAISFYKKMNFELVGNINWKKGTLPGYVFVYGKQPVTRIPTE
jgi:hypothetical protein